MNNLSFRNKLLIAILPVVAISIAVVAIVSYQIAAKNIVDLQRSNLIHIVDKTNEQLATWVQERIDFANIMSEIDLFKDACQGENKSEAQALLEKMVKKYPMYENLFLATTDGQLFLAGAGDVSGVNISQIPIYAVNHQKALAAQHWVGDVAKSPVSGRPVSLLTAPIIRDGQVIGIMGTPLELNHFSKATIADIKLGETGYLFMIDSKGIMLAHPKEENILKLDVTKYDFGKQMVKEKSGITEYDWEGREKFAYFAEFEGKGWIVAASAYIDEYMKPVVKIRNISALLGLFAVLLITGITVILTTRISNLIKSIVDAIKDIAQGEGDLTRRLEVSSHDEFGDLANWFNTFVGKLRDIIVSVKDGSEQLASASNEISASAEEMAAGAEEQQAQLSEVAASMEEMSAMILEASNSAGQTHKNAQSADDAAVEGKSTVSKTVEGIQAIADIVQTASGQISTLDGRSQEIGDVIQVIDDIADQTNLLALNANIEAARAGDAGRGFAVVADEVRKLAERTVNATAEIGEKIKLIQSDIGGSVDAMNSISVQSKDGQELAIDSGKALDNIVDVINNVYGSVSQISQATTEQSTGAEEISRNIESVSTVSKQAAAGAQELAKSAEELNHEVHGLNNLVSQFKV